MSIKAVVKRKRKTREGKGFNKEELKEVGLSFKQALKLRIPIDIRRSTIYKENVKKLKILLRRDLEKPVKKQKKEVIIGLSKVKGIGPKLSEKLKKADIKNANILAKSNPKKIAQVIGSSEKRASKLIESAYSLLKAK